MNFPKLKILSKSLKYNFKSKQIEDEFVCNLQMQDLEKLGPSSNHLERILLVVKRHSTQSLDIFP